VLRASLAAFGFGHFVALLLLAAALSTWVYWHASRHGSRHATAWAIAAFFLVAVPVYIVRHYATRRRL
jgi:hypothetical protein